MGQTTLRSGLKGVDKPRLRKPVFVLRHSQIMVTSYLDVACFVVVCYEDVWNCSLRNKEQLNCASECLQ
jgi:hypothetical protein